MKKYFFLLLGMGLFSSASYGQRRVIDSLTAVLSQQKQDTNRVKTLNALGYYLFGTRPDSAVGLSIEAIDLSRKLKF